MVSGKLTYAILLTGLISLAITVSIPGKGMWAIYTVLITPIVATLATATELLISKHYKEALSLASAIALILIAAIWSAN